MHHSSSQLENLKAPTYEELKQVRLDYFDNDIKATNKYLKSRKEEENKYHKLLNSDKSKSFIYLTIVGFNKMEPALEYPGFTYYFKLSNEQIENTLFGVIAGKNKSLDVEPAIGKESLIKCLKHWYKFKDKMKSYEDDIVNGYIDPRIEIITQENIYPKICIPEIEQR